MPARSWLQDDLMMSHKPKILVLVGPTASGKSELAVSLAKKFNGEIISADSRQIYKGMDLGTGKVPGRWILAKAKPTQSRGRAIVSYGTKHERVFVYKNIRHHLIDFVSPEKQYSAALFQNQAKEIIANVIRRGKLPILCGGTAHWIDAVIYNQVLPNVKPNFKLRARLEKKSAPDLYQQLKKLDPARAKSIDRHNKRRLIRALEIVITTGKPVPQLFATPSAAEGSLNSNLPSRVRDSSDAFRMVTYNALWLGINPAPKTLYKKIDARLKQRLKAGMLKEVSRLHTQGLSWKKLESFGLEYKFISLYLQNKLSKEEMVKQLSYAIKHYSKRQMTWWKRNKNIIWLNSPLKAGKALEKFLNLW